jgi:hypothetical protein
MAVVRFARSARGIDSRHVRKLMGRGTSRLLLRSCLSPTCFVSAEGLMFVSDWNAGMHVLEYKG